MAADKKKADKKKKKSPQGSLLLWHGLRLPLVWKFLRMKPKLSWSRAHYIMALLPTGMHNSFWSFVEKIFYGSKIRKTEVKDPVFVLGHWRSGTTLLHNLVSMDNQFTFSNLYETLFPDHFLMTENVMTKITQHLVPDKRPMDNMKAGWELPQEDEIGLLNSTLISHYLLNGLQGNPEKYDHFLDLKDVEPKVREQWKDALLRFMKKLTIRNNKPIVLKSPGHTARIPLLLEMFPNAKFIYIYRNPYAVLKSSIHVRNTLIEANRLGPIDFSTVEGEILYNYEKLMKLYEDEKKMIPEGHLHELQYEELEKDPIGVLSDAYETLNLDNFEYLKSKIEEELPRLQSYKKNKFEIPEEQRERWYAQMKFVFDRYGYPEHLENTNAESKNEDTAIKNAS